MWIQRDTVARTMAMAVIALFLSAQIFPAFAAQTSYTLTYDANGNLLQDTSNYYEYDSMNNLVKVRAGGPSGQITAQYFYDDAGQRVKKIDYSGGTSKTTYYVDKSFIREVDASGTKDTLYYYDESVLVARKDSNGSMYYYHPNHLGSTDIVTDAGGNVVEDTDYAPYGEVLAGGSSRYLFTGQESDKESGLDYFNARYYSSFLKHFTQPDSILPDIYDPQQLNRYAYARDNPLKYKDPTGHIAWLAVAGVGALIGGLVGAGYSLYDQMMTSDSINGWDVLQSALLGAAIGSGASLIAAAIAPLIPVGVAAALSTAAVTTINAVGPENFLGGTGAATSAAVQTAYNAVTGNPLSENVDQAAAAGYVMGILSGPISYAVYSLLPGTIGAMSGGRDIVGSKYGAMKPTQPGGKVNPDIVLNKQWRILLGDKPEVKVNFFEDRGRYISDGHHTFVAYSKMGVPVNEMNLDICAFPESDFAYGGGPYDDWSEIVYGQFTPER